ncbi:complement C1q-like protein 3 [Ylistrum balloti]|uniref:complement C1q-like protein 3 n=1 Tax=Ylistrum balloti TaxID=509963 RepID=UPI002905F578|nr:complement C1q-like protein 3 [Ylistrum balloti]
MFYDKNSYFVFLALVCISFTYGTEQSDIVSKRLVQLEAMVDVLTRDRTDSDRRLKEVETSARQQKSHLEQELNAVQNELSALQHKYRDLSSQLEYSASKTVRSDTKTTMFAFSASLSNRTSNFHRNEKIVMDHVLTNNGESYDPKTGVFTCQQPGTYVFSVTIQAEDRHRFVAEIVKNAEEVGRVLADPMYSRASASTSVILNLTSGDTVYIRSDGSFDQSHASIDEYFSSFSGFLIEVVGWVSFGNK